MNNFDIKQKWQAILFYYMIPTPNKISEDKGQQNATNFRKNTRSFRNN